MEGKNITTLILVNSVIYELKKQFDIKPSDTKFSFSITTEILSEKFDEDLFKTKLCQDLNCIITRFKKRGYVVECIGEKDSSINFPHLDFHDIIERKNYEIKNKI